MNLLKVSIYQKKYTSTLFIKIAHKANLRIAYAFKIIR